MPCRDCLMRVEVTWWISLGGIVGGSECGGRRGFNTQYSDRTGLGSIEKDKVQSTSGMIIKS